MVKKIIVTRVSNGVKTQDVLYYNTTTGQFVQQPTEPGAIGAFNAVCAGVC